MWPFGTNHGSTANRANCPVCYREHVYRWALLKALHMTEATATGKLTFTSHDPERVGGWTLVLCADWPARS